MKATTAVSLSRSPATPASEPGSGSAISVMSVALTGSVMSVALTGSVMSTAAAAARAVSGSRTSRPSAERVEATSSDDAVTATPSITSSDSGTTVRHRSAVGAARSAVTTRPRGASSVVVPTIRSRTTVNEDTASTPSMTVVRWPVVRSTRWTSTRVQPSDTSITSQRPSRDSSTDGHAVLSGRSPNTSSSWPGSSPTTCHHTVRW